MDFLKALESIRSPFLDAVMSAVTTLGEETLFLAVGLFVFWCVNKYKGYYVLFTGLLTTIINQVLKLIFRIPRPWVRDEGFSIVESAREAATGYSFPSGHTASAAVTMGGIARFSRRIWVRAVCIALLALVALSRMYLGVHTLLDVSVSLIISLVLVFALYPLFVKAEQKPVILYYICGALMLFAAAEVLFTELFPFPADIDADNLDSGLKTGYTLLGTSVGIFIAVILDNRYTHFETHAVWWAQILKTALGLGTAIAIRMALKPVLNGLFGGHHAADAIRYLAVTVFAGAVWPLTFKWFASMGKKSIR